jgi:hypothetical protein
LARAKSAELKTEKLHRPAIFNGSVKNNAITLRTHFLGQTHAFLEPKSKGRLCCNPN